MKSQTSLIEVIISAIILLIAFNIMISVEEYSTKWDDAIASVNGKDILLTADRLNTLYGHSFSSSSFRGFINQIGSVQDSIVNFDVQGAVKPTIYVACDCTSDQVFYIQGILSDVKFNGRNVNAAVCSTVLPAINTCGSGSDYPDVLVVWGYRNLDPYLSQLTAFVNNGGGIIEIADMGEIEVTASQQRIFGLKWLTNDPFPVNLDGFLKPRNASTVSYQPYKWFYHLPYTLSSSSVQSVPIEGGIPACTLPATEGNFKFADVSRKFWICGGTSVYFDTDTPANGVADTIVLEGQNFVIGSSNFLLSYIETNDKIRVSFKQDYLFNDFLVKDEASNKLFPFDDDTDKILMNSGYWDITREFPVSVSIVNGGKSLGTTIWIPDFSRGGLGNTGDDHKQMLSSFIFSIVDKRIKERFSTVGKITSYINTEDVDIFEVYRIDLEIGSPF